MKTWDKWKKKELLSLPVREWDKTTEYDAVLLVNTKQKHDSGYNCFAVIGCIESEPVEIAGFMDDFRLGNMENFFIQADVKTNLMAIDCSMHGVFRIHYHGKIKVGINTSTTNFWFEDK